MDVSCVESVVIRDPIFVKVNKHEGFYYRVPTLIYAGLVALFDPPDLAPRKPHNHRGIKADSYSTRRALSNGARHFARDAREVDDPDFSDPAATLRTNNHSPHPLGVWGNHTKIHCVAGPSKTTQKGPSSLGRFEGQITSPNVFSPWILRKNKNG